MPLDGRLPVLTQTVDGDRSYSLFVALAEELPFPTLPGAVAVFESFEMILRAR